MRWLTPLLLLCATAHADLARPKPWAPPVCEPFEELNAKATRCVMQAHFVITPGGPVAGVTPKKTTAEQVLKKFGQRCQRENDTRVICPGARDLPAAFTVKDGVVETIELESPYFRTVGGVLVGNVATQVKSAHPGKLDPAAAEWRYPGISFFFGAERKVTKIVVRSLEAP
jgi:hypothetical protein